MITKCLFPVAGYGTRFLPAGKAHPKEVLLVLAAPPMSLQFVQMMNFSCRGML
jgi:UTP--glucose-1-phosphate uridylyltransferase